MTELLPLSWPTASVSTVNRNLPNPARSSTLVQTNLKLYCITANDRPTFMLLTDEVIKCECIAWIWPGSGLDSVSSGSTHSSDGLIEEAPAELLPEVLDVEENLNLPIGGLWVCVRVRVRGL